MCLGVPGRVAEWVADQPTVAMVDIEGVARRINMGLLDTIPAAGDWVLVHMGFAMETMTTDEAERARSFMRGEVDAVADLLQGSSRDPFLPE